MATLTTKFNLGDEVWHIYPDREVVKLPCRFCRGKGWVRATGDGDESRQVKCPDCTHAVVALGAWPVWKVKSSPLVIGKVQVEVYDHARADNGESAVNRNPALSDAEDQETYMAWSTGVGSGTVYYADDLFARRTEAEDEAAQRTERARAGEDPGGGRRGYQREWWPDAEQVRVAGGFLDHRDIYEHDAGHVALAEAIIEVAKKREAH